MKAWVVAKEGLVGSELMSYLQKKGVPCVGTNHKEVDIIDKKAVEKFVARERPTHIFNCAAFANVDACESEQEMAYQVNVMGTVHLAEVAKKQGIKLVHISTDYVFDGEKDTDYSESDQVAPVNVYGKTKEEGERRLLEVYPSAVSVRTSSLYGVGKKGLVWYTLEALRSKKVMQQIADQTSAPTYVTDLVEALYAVRDASGIVHFANKGHVSRYGLCKEVYAIAKERGVSLMCEKIEPVLQADVKRAAIRPKRTVLACHKIEPLLKRPIRTWQEALREYMGTIA